MHPTDDIAVKGCQEAEIVHEIIIITTLQLLLLLLVLLLLLLLVLQLLLLSHCSIRLCSQLLKPKIHSGLVVIFQQLWTLFLPHCW